MQKKADFLVVSYVLYLLLIWTGFRYFVRLPEAIDELWFKPILWIVPIFWINTIVKVKFYGGSFWRAMVTGLIVGVAMGGILGVLLGRKPDFNWNNLGIGFVTGVTEMVVFAGFLLPIFRRKFSLEWSLVFTSALFLLIHLPIAVFIYQYSGRQLLGFGLLTFCQMVIYGYLSQKTNNVWAAILAYWGFLVLI